MSVVINIAEVLNTRYPVSEEQAQPLYTQLQEAVAKRTHTILSFKNIETCSTIFLNYLLGKLYRNYGKAVDQLVSYVDIDADDDVLTEQLDRVKYKALNPEQQNRIVGNALIR